MLSQNTALLSLCTLVGLLWTTTLAAQERQYTSHADADPAATALLDAVREKYEAYHSLEARFKLTIEIPEEAPYEDEGYLAQAGDRYRLDLSDQLVVCDGQSVWVWLKANEEVQINDADPEDEGEVWTPRDLLTIYESEDFVYVLAGTAREGKRTLQAIEFKPLDRDSEYSKVRLLVDKNTHDIVRVTTFQKDGTRMTLELKTLTPNKQFDPSLFTFSKSLCPTCHYEDLRL